jgi:hypothetical protein
MKGAGGVMLAQVFTIQVTDMAEGAAATIEKSAVAAADWGRGEAGGCPYVDEIERLAACYSSPQIFSSHCLRHDLRSLGSLDTARRCTSPVSKLLRTWLRVVELPQLFNQLLRLETAPQPHIPSIE